MMPDRSKNANKTKTAHFCTKNVMFCTEKARFALQRLILYADMALSLVIRSSRAGGSGRQNGIERKLGLNNQEM